MPLWQFFWLLKDNTSVGSGCLEAHGNTRVISDQGRARLGRAWDDVPVDEGVRSRGGADGSTDWGGVLGLEAWVGAGGIWVSRPGVSNLILFESYFLQMKVAES